MTTLTVLQSLISRSESETLELKRSTAELRRAGETLCAFLNGEGGQVVIGVSRHQVGTKLGPGSTQFRDQAHSLR